MLLLRSFKTSLCLALFLFFYLPAIAQKNSIKGIVIDTAENKKLHFSIVALIDQADSALYHSFRTDIEGKFEITKIPAGRYSLMVSYPRMADYLQDIIITDTSKIDLGRIIMVTQAVLLEEVIVRSGLPIRMRGDTLEYTADSFAARPGANVEELLKRLPGFQVEKDGKIIAQGQEVKKILVDGDEFFSDDPGLATRYLNADAIDKVQVFDDRSEQAKFTGIDDGTRTKTINLKLKKNKKNGYFGKLAAGSDGKEYYNHEAMGALFNNNKKMSLFGLSSKIGKEGISNNELTKYVGQDYEIINDGTGSSIFYNNSDYENEDYWGNGLPSIMSGGAHYSDKWKDARQKLFTNYRIKEINANGWSNNNGTYTLPDGTGFANRGESTDRTYSFSQKASGSFITPVDSFSTIKISINGGLSRGNSNNSSFSESKNEKGFFVNNSRQSYRRTNEGKNVGSNISFQKKFRKDGRTLSLLLQHSFNDRNNDNYNYSENNYYTPSSGQFKNADTLNQLQQNQSQLQSYAARIGYTDKLTKYLGISTEYGWKTTISDNVFNTFNGRNTKYDERVDSLSNDYTFTSGTHIAGAVFSIDLKKINITVGSKLYFTSFDQVNNDLKTETRRSFTNLAPHIGANIKLKANASIRFQYSGQTIQPSVEQLQPLRRSSNKLYVQIGNPDLQPGFSHSASVNFNKFEPVKGNSIYGSISMNYTLNGVASKTTTDSLGRTISQYINMNGMPGMNGYLSYNWNYKKLKLRPSATLSFNKYGNMYIQNNKKVKNESMYINASAGMRHTWENHLTTGYTARLIYNIGWSDIPGYKTRLTFSHVHSFNITSYFLKKFELGSDCSFNFQPKNSSFNKNLNTIRWNASLQRKFLKGDKGAIKLSMNDILNNNTGYSRNVSGNNINEWNRSVIKRYWLLTLTWNFSKSIK
ncbi:MAG TPA: outer membrane beta-barrel protein [Chitinophagaceae bacterium]